MRRLPHNFHAVDHYDAKPPPHWIVLFPARTVMPFLRTPLGYNIVHPSFALRAAMGLCFLPLAFWALYVAFTNRPPPVTLGHQALMVFAIAGFVSSCVIFAQRAIGQRRGVEIHTSEAGFSHLTWQTGLPVMLCEQVIVPAALMLVGYVVAQTLSFELGWWLVIAGVSYLVMARWEYTRRLAQTRTTIDDMIRAHTFEERLGTHERQARRSPSGSKGNSREEPNLVTLVDEEPLAHPPNVATWSGESDSAVPTAAIGWLRRARGLGRR